MSNKTVYIEGYARFMRPFYLDKGENLDEGSEIRKKIEETDGIYVGDIVLDFDNRDDAEEYLNSKGVPTDGMMGNLLKRDKETKEVYYRAKRPNVDYNLNKSKDSDEKGLEFGAPRVVDSENKTWDEDVLIGNGSKVTMKLNVWKGSKVTKVRWDGLRVDDLVEYVPEDGGF